MAQLPSTNLIQGPFVIIVTDPRRPDDDVFQVIGGFGPEDKSFATKEEAQSVIDEYARRAEPYLGLDFRIAGLRDAASFKVFCSWED